MPKADIALFGAAGVLVAGAPVAQIIFGDVGPIACTDRQRMINKRPQGEEPRSEPEIIPPGPAERDRPRMRVYIDERIGRVYIAKPGPFGTILSVLIVGLLLTVMLIMMLGAFLSFCPWSSYLLPPRSLPGYCGFIFSVRLEAKTPRSRECRKPHFDVRFTPESRHSRSCWNVR